MPPISVSTPVPPSSVLLPELPVIWLLSMLPVPLLCAARFGAPFVPQAEETRGDYLDRARAAVLALAR